MLCRSVALTARRSGARRRAAASRGLQCAHAPPRPKLKSYCAGKELEGDRPRLIQTGSTVKEVRQGRSLVTPHLIVTAVWLCPKRLLCSPVLSALPFLVPCMLRR
ncbi:hypothetical protein AOLI_G00014140 [Acnodon oligacanthus]